MIAGLRKVQPFCPEKPQEKALSKENLFPVLILILLLCLVPLTILIADIIPINHKTTGLFSFTYGKSETDDNAQALIQSKDGGYAIAGITWSYGNGMSDIWLIKTNSLGTPEWNQTYGGEKKDYAFSLIQTQDGGYALAGGTWSYGNGMSDIWLIKTDDKGVIEWENTFGGNKEEGASSIVESNDGFVIAGFTNSYGNQSSDIWLIKTNKEGNLIWTQQYGGVGEDVAYSLIQTRYDEGFAIAGCTSSYGAGNKDMWFIKTDYEGRMQWSQTYGGRGRDQAQALVETQDGYVLAGETRQFNEQYRDFWLVKITRNGDTLWTKTYGCTEREWAETVIQTRDGGFLMAGYTTTQNTGGYTDIMLVKTDSKGEEQWTTRFGGERHDLASALLETQEGFLLSGITNAHWYIPYYGGGDIWLVKIDNKGQIANREKPNPQEWETIIKWIGIVPLMIWYIRDRVKIKKNTR